MKISDEELVEDLVRVKELVNKIPTQQDYYDYGKFSTTTYTNRKPWSKWTYQIFGIKTKAQESKRKTRREDLIENLLNLYNKLNRAPKKEDLKLGKYGVSGYNREFGNFSNALIEVGLKPNQRRGLSDEEIIEDVRRIYKELGRTPTTEEFDSNSKTILSASVHNRFESWTKFLIIADIPVEKANKVSKQDAIDALNAWYNKNNKDVNCLGYWRIRKARFRREFPYSCETISNKFDNIPWEEIMKTIDPAYESVNQFTKRAYFEGKDGNIYLSSIELRAGNILYDCKMNNDIKDYKYEELVLKERNWTCDFKVLLNNDEYLWIEIDGMRSNRKDPYNSGRNEKIEYYKENNFNYVIISYNYDVKKRIKNAFKI